MLGVAFNLKRAEFGVGCLLIAAALRVLFLGGFSQFRPADLLILLGAAMILLMAWGLSKLF